MHQERRFPGRVVGTALKNPDFLALARAYGAFGASITRTEEFVSAFEAAAAHSGPAIIELIATVLAAHGEAVAQYRGGKAATFGFLVGQVMKAAGGRANPKRVNELLRRALTAAS